MGMVRLAAILVLVAGLEQLAVAQPGMTAAQPGMTAPTPSEPLSEGTALALSLGGTAASYALLFGGALGGSGTAELVGLGGVMLAPSFGHWYADKYLTRGLGLRAAGLGVVITGAMIALSECPLTFDHSAEPCEESALPSAVAIAGLGLFVWGTLDDIVTAPRRVRARNAAHPIAVVPTLRGDGGGLAIAGRF